MSDLPRFRRSDFLPSFLRIVALAALIPAVSLPVFAAGERTGRSFRESRREKTTLGDSPEDSAVLSAWAEDGYRFTSRVEKAFLDRSKARTIAELKSRDVALPADFLAWVDGDPARALDIYCTRKNPADTLLWLRSLEIDAGVDNVRNKYAQLALAMATVAVAKGDKADITPRPPLALVIGGDPRKPVNTKDTSRPLDMNDHIVNFLEDHPPILGDVVGGMAEALPDLVYNDRGVAVTSGKDGKVPDKIQRPVLAADVIADAGLQKEFNDYMKAKGQDVRIDCGDRVIFPGQTAMIEGPHAKGIDDAYRLFRTAYEAKGRIPIRDRPATYAERFLYIIRNDKPGAFPATYLAKGKKKELPSFPLTSPWPMLTYLAEDDQPLREREDMLVRLKNRGEFHTYGEYIGPIAQQTEYQRARRLAPFEYGYKIEGQSNVGRDPIQMMIKDGGVCGTMAAMQVCSFNIVNVPSCTAGQPAHCALIFARRDDKSGKYAFEGAQYATGGDEVTSPHAPWYPGDIGRGKAMVWHKSLAYGLNFGTDPFFKSLAALRLYRQLPSKDSKEHGGELLGSAAVLNPFDIAPIESAFASAGSAEEALKLWARLKPAVLESVKAAGLVDKKGEPDVTGGLYLKALEDLLAERLDRLPRPTDPAVIALVNQLVDTRSAAVAAAKEKARATQASFEKTLKKGA